MYLSPDVLAATASVWADRALPGDPEDFSVRWSALVHTAARWVRDHLSADWLCPRPESAATRLNTFRQSEAVLSWLDFSLVCDRPLGCLPVGEFGFLLCRAGRQRAIEAGGLCFGPAFSVREALLSNDWLHVRIPLAFLA